jgi:hypothetical protein
MVYPPHPNPLPPGEREKEGPRMIYHIKNPIKDQFEIEDEIKICV